MESTPENLEKLRQKGLNIWKKKKKVKWNLFLLSSRKKAFEPFSFKLSGRKKWKKNSKIYRDQKAKIRKNSTRLSNKKPFFNSKPAVEPACQNNCKHQGLIATQRRMQLRKHRAIQYAKIAKLEKSLKEEIRKKKKYCKSCLIFFRSYY